MSRRFLPVAPILVLAFLVGGLSAIACGSSSKSATPTPAMTMAPAATETKAPQATPTVTPTRGPPQSVTATISDTGVTPMVIEIRVGDTVTWTNNGSSIQRLVQDRSAFDSGNLSVGQTFSHTFQTAGAFPYHDEFHSQWTAVVEVQ